MASMGQRLATAAQLQRDRRWNEAEAIYREILQAEPGHIQAQHLLGLLCHETGRSAETIELLRQVIDRHGPNPIVESNLAAAYLTRGLLGNAEKHARSAVHLKPELPDAHFNLGVALRRQGRYQEAVASFRQVLRFDPAHLDARTNLGAAFQQAGQQAEAVAVLRETVTLHPRNAQARSDLGGVLLACRRLDEAIAQLRESIRLQPNLIAAHHNLGLTLRDLGQLDEAIGSFQEALRLNPGYAPARIGLAYTLEIQHRFADAIDEYQETLKRDPTNTWAISSLSLLAQSGHYSFEDRDLQQYETMTAQLEVPREDASRLEFALGNLLDVKQQTTEAFRHYQRGNELRKEIEARRGNIFEPARHRQGIGEIIEFFDAAFFRRVADLGSDSELPVFIVGMPRSGTTLVEQILASHPQVFGAGELQEFPRLVGTLASLVGQGNVGYPKCLDLIPSDIAAHLANDHLQRLRRLGGAAERVVDKLPFNFLHLGLICAAVSQGSNRPLSARSARYLSLLLFPKLWQSAGVHARPRPSGALLP